MFLYISLKTKKSVRISCDSQGKLCYVFVSLWFCQKSIKVGVQEPKSIMVLRFQIQTWRWKYGTWLFKFMEQLVYARIQFKHIRSFRYFSDVRVGFLGHKRIRVAITIAIASVLSIIVVFHYGVNSDHLWQWWNSLTWPSVQHSVSVNRYVNKLYYK